MTTQGSNVQVMLADVQKKLSRFDTAFGASCPDTSALFHAIVDAVNVMIQLHESEPVVTPVEPGAQQAWQRLRDQLAAKDELIEALKRDVLREFGNANAAARERDEALKALATKVNRIRVQEEMLVTQSSNYQSLQNEFERTMNERDTIVAAVLALKNAVK